MTTIVNVEDKVLDGTYSGPVTVEISEDLNITGLDALTEFSNEMNGIKDNTKTYANAAKNSELAAASQVSLAENEKLAATAQADRAKTEADRASLITGLDTVSAAVDTALNNEYISARSEADMDAMRAEVNRVTDASGFVAMGQSYIGSGGSKWMVNEGMFGDSGEAIYANKFRLGAINTPVGKSKTLHPVTAIAGFITAILNLSNTGDYGSAVVKLPTAPIDGTCTFDSATGEYTDFKTEADPKYGNMPTGTPVQIRNEAVSRAHEGDVKNGDGRLGTANWGTSGSCIFEVEDGWFKLTQSATWIRAYQSIYSIAEYAGKKIIAEFEAYTTSAYGAVDLTKSIAGTPGNDESSKRTLLSPTPTKYTVNLTGNGTDSLYINFASQDAGDIVYVRNISIRPVTNEVVTAPVDMWGFEGSLQPVTPENPFIYPNGLPQSLAATMDGVATKRSNRPNSYYAWFEGDETSAGLGCDFFAANILQRDLWLSNPKNKLFKMKDGTITQWRVKGRSFRGPGNGDWSNIDSNTVGGYLSFDAKNRVQPQGGLDTQGGLADSSEESYSGSSYDTRPTTGKGLFSLRDSWQNSDKFAINGECYFLVCGTVPRLNQGAYYPDLNENGCCRVRNVVNDSGSQWYAPSVLAPTRQAQCFITTTVANPTGGVKEPDVKSGTIAGGVVYSGHPEGHAYDAIYPSGEGGVIDERQSAFGVTPDERARKLRMVEDGTYRGKEKLKFTRVLPSAAAGSGSHPNAAKKVYTASGLTLVVLLDTGTYKLSTGDTVFLRNSTLNKLIFGVVGAINPAYIYVNATSEMTEADWAGDDVFIIQTTETNRSVSGEFLQKEVIGDPVNILANPVLKNGFGGVWNPTIPAGIAKVYPVTRKNVGAVPAGLLSADAGVTWTVYTPNFDFIENELTSRTLAPDEVVILNYTAFSKQTKKSTLKNVVGAQREKVMFTDSHKRDEAALLHESLMGAVDAVGTGANFMSYSVLAEQIKGVIKVTEYQPIKLTGSASPAVKVQPYFFTENGQENIGFIANEMKWTSDFGDSSSMSLTGDTYTNDNGGTCRNEVHELTIPIGWSINHI